MAIETTIELSPNKSLSGVYAKIENPTSYKDNSTEKQIVKLRYRVEYYSEKEGMLIKHEEKKDMDYKGGDIWEEAYSHLKTVHKNCKDV